MAKFSHLILCFGWILASFLFLPFVVRAQNPNPSMRDLLEQYRKTKDDTLKLKIALNHDPEGLEPLLAAAQDPDMKEAVAGGLGNYKDPRAVKVLTADLKDPSVSVRGRAALSLSFIADPDSAPALLEASHDPDPQVRDNAIEALNLLDVPGVVPALLKALKDPSTSVRITAAIGLKNRKGPEVVSGLLEAASDPDAGVRESVFPALAVQKDPRAVGPLAKAAKDKDPSVRAAAVESLGNLGDPKGLPAVLAAQKDPDANVIKQAQEAFPKFPPESYDQLKPQARFDLYCQMFPKMDFQGARQEEISLKLFQVVRLLKKKPATPEDYDRYMTRGKLAFKGIEDIDGFHKAMNEFRNAIHAAPWKPDPYYNMGLIREKEAEAIEKGMNCAGWDCEPKGDYGDAVRYMNLYLAGALKVPDAAKVKKLIYELEYKRDNAK